jgi:aspartyl-tRNA(Asn)/glutamyl-tRNA(Gln) amidotransferase subunit A
MSNDVAFRSLRALAQGLRAGEFSALELTRSFLDRIGKADGKLNAYAEVYPEQALAAAEAADRVRRSGWPIGSLHGLPIAIKDLCDIAGKVGTVGSKAWSGRRGATTATVVERLTAAGMIVLGKTHMVEFAFGGWGTNPLCGTPWNPWDLTTHRVPGGSSSGSGVAVAAGLAPAAIGSDTGGSVRIPAAFNGIVGLKTTFGRVSLHGCFPLSTTLDSIGPMTRTVADAGALLAILAGPDSRDPNTSHAPALSIPDLHSSDVRGLRVVVLPDSTFPGPVDPAVRSAYAEAIRVFRTLGVSVEERPFPFSFEELTARNGELIATEAYAIHRAYIEDETLAIGPAVRARVLGGKKVSAADYIATREHQRQAIGRFAAWMEGIDAVLTPAVAAPAIPVSNVDEKLTPATFTRAGNYVGACGLALPAGLSPQTLPVGIQLLGKAFAEGTLLRLGAAFEAETGWTRRTPDLKGLVD